MKEFYSATTCSIISLDKVKDNF